MTGHGKVKALDHAFFNYKFELINTKTPQPAWIKLCEHIEMFSNDMRTGNSVRCRVCRKQFSIRCNWRGE